LKGIALRWPKEVLELMSDLGYSIYGVNSSGELIEARSISDSITETHFFFVHPGPKLACAIQVFFLIELSKPHQFYLN